MWKTYDLEALLSENDYPGRGIVLGRSPDGTKAVMVYFIMGRSVNSRNRVFLLTEDGIRTEAFDPAKLSDPSLIIYPPVRVWGNWTIVSNGDQTDTIRDFMCVGKTMEAALKTRTFEPDGPNFTPRISGVVRADGTYKLSILKSLDGDPSCCVRQYFDYDHPAAGVGHFIHTYMMDGEPLSRASRSAWTSTAKLRGSSPTASGPRSTRKTRCPSSCGITTLRRVRTRRLSLIRTRTERVRSEELGVRSCYATSLLTPNS